MARQGAGSPPGAMRIIDGVIFRACRNRRHSSKNRILREDETRAYGAHHLAIGCLIFEGRAEFFLFAEIQDPRQDSAGKGHTALCQESEGEIARETASKGPAEPHRLRLPAVGISAGFFDQLDLAGDGRGLPGRSASRKVQTQEARAGKDGFHANPPKRIPIKIWPERGFLRPERPEIHVACLTWQDEMAITRLGQSRGAEPCAKP